VATPKNASAAGEICGYEIGHGILPQISQITADGNSIYLSLQIAGPLSPPDSANGAPSFSPPAQPPWVSTPQNIRGLKARDKTSNGVGKKEEARLFRLFASLPLTPSFSWVRSPNRDSSQPFPTVPSRLRNTPRAVNPNHSRSSLVCHMSFPSSIICTAIRKSLVFLASFLVQMQQPPD
jgi:hypothetical protein